MPDNSGRMTEAEVQKIVDYLKSLAPKAPACEFCRTTNWTINTHITIPQFFGDQSPPVVYPHFSVVCTKCGHTKFFSAVMVPGLLPEAPADFKPVEPAKTENPNG